MWGFDRLDNGAVGDDGILADDNNTILDDVAICLAVNRIHVVLVYDLDVHTNAGVLVNDGPPDDGAGADTDGGAAGEVLALVGLLVVVGTHDHGVLDDAVLLDVGAETDHRVRELALLDEAAVTDGAL